MLRLDDREWRPFFIEDIADILSGQDIYEKERVEGDTPYATATANNNGIGYFVGNENETLERDCLSVNRNGSVGYCFYHPYPTLYGNDTRKLRPRIANKYTSLFISMAIVQQRGKYGYGYKMGTGRLKRQRVLLPSVNGEPDWAFMEEYMRWQESQVAVEQLSCQQMNVEDANVECQLQTVCWEPFYFTDIFTEIQRGKRLKKADHVAGSTPYVSSTARCNGIDGFIGNARRVKVFENCLTLANSGSVGNTFFHPYAFVASDHVTQLRRPGLDKYAYLFLAALVGRIAEKYNFNREISDERLQRERILLPVNVHGEIDFAFMSSFMRRVEARMCSNIRPMLRGGGREYYLPD